MMLRVPGKTTPRLLQDLLEYDSRRPRQDGKNGLLDPPPIYREGKLFPLRVRPQDCQHKLSKKDSQSLVPGTADTANTSLKYISASFCERCLHHYDVIVDYSDNTKTLRPCSLHDPEFPLHHLQYQQSFYRTSADFQTREDIYSGYKESHRWICSAPQCSVVVEVRITPPRLSPERLSCVLDSAKVFKRGKRTIEENPERYQDRGPMLPNEILVVLRTYLNDALNKAPEEMKRIAARNKRFLLAFSDECNDLLEYLGFISHQEPGPSEGDSPDEFWILPSVKPHSEPFSEKSNRQFLEDVMWELSQRLADRGIEDQRVKFVHQALPALKDIQKVLGCNGYPTCSRNVNLDRDEHPHYAGLGAVGDFEDSLIIFAYSRQRICDIENQPYYLECLQGIANGRNSADLMEEMAKALSLGEFTMQGVENAYKFFNIDSSKEYPDEWIIGQYLSRIDSAPRQKDEGKQCLLIIGKVRNSPKIIEVANDRSMTVMEAYELLTATADVDSDFLASMAVSIADEIGDKGRVAQALRTIATARDNDFTLNQAADRMDSGSGGFILSVEEAYTRLQIGNPDSSPDETVFTYYTSLANASGSGTNQSYKDALLVIANARNSDYLRAKVKDPNAIPQAQRGSAENPVGLNNIGNTCYLNSLLQYYYTVRPVRDTVMDFESFRMPLTVGNIAQKRVGGRVVSKDEIRKAQEFVEELQGLYKNLKSAPTQSVRPTQNLAELTLISTATEANFRRASISSPTVPSILGRPAFGPELSSPPPPEVPPPPVPTRAAPAPVTDMSDIEMLDRPQDVNDEDDDNSDSTLVNLELSQVADDMDVASNVSTTVLDKSNVNQGSAIDSSIDADMPMTDEPSKNEVMISGGMLTPTSDTEFNIPDKAPPIPPRNKPAPIQTAQQSDDIMRNQRKLEFGAQQDVTEVIGNVMFRLQCAIKPTSIDPKFGEQIDKIRDTFYGANAVSLKKANTYDKKVEDWGNIIVFPGATNTRSIYEALDVVFDEQVVEIDKAETTQFASIDKLPPILQIQIQRTAFDPATQQASKNQNQIIFDETIYLDRYMDSEKVLQRRRIAWKWKGRMRQLEARRNALGTTKTQISVTEALSGTKEFLDALESADIQDVVVDSALSGVIEERISELSYEMSDIDREIAEIKKKLNDQFTDMLEHRYRLQAVFMHRGSHQYGHYWIYIYDFKSDKWREYNDERVSEVHDRKRIFEQQPGSMGSQPATPYYLVYVRDDEKDDLVEAVHREIIEDRNVVSSSDVVENSWVSGMQDDSAHIKGSAEHVEHATPEMQSISSPGRNSTTGEANGQRW